MLLRSAQDDDRPGQMERKSHHLAVDIGPLSAPVCLHTAPWATHHQKEVGIGRWNIGVHPVPQTRVSSPGNTQYSLMSCSWNFVSASSPFLASSRELQANLYYCTCEDPHVPWLVHSGFSETSVGVLLGTPLFWCLSLGTRRHISAAGVAVKTGVFENAAGERRGGEGRSSLTGSGGPGWPATRTRRLGKPFD